MTQVNTASSTILAIDSTSNSCSVGVWKNGGKTAYCEEMASALQSKRLILMIEEALGKSDTGYSDLSSIACTVGPGSFTGIRIGLASARAIGFAASIPVFGFNALEVLAFGAIQQNPGTPVLAILNAGKGEIIYQHFSPELEAICPPTLSPCHPTLIAGSPDVVTRNECVVINTYPRADILARLAASRPDRAIAPLPFYVRPPDAKLP